MKYKKFAGVLYADGAKPWEIGLALLRRALVLPAPNWPAQYFWTAYGVKNVFTRTYWMGVPAWKPPSDFWTYQEILWETRPQVLIETGTKFGGSALFFACMFDLLGDGEVITVDIGEVSPDPRSVKHPRITQIVGDSVSLSVVEQIRTRLEGRSAMVSLDSNHNRAHVLKELELYSQFVPVGKYVVVEDTRLPGGPKEAVRDFLRQHPQFERDSSWEKFMLSVAHNGFLRRVR